MDIKFSKGKKPSIRGRTARRKVVRNLGRYDRKFDKFWIPQNVHDESALTGDLKIVRLDHVVSPAKGNKEIFILVERVTKKNIKIRFYELDDEDNVIWEDWGKFNDLDVHHQYAIVFKTPKYRDETITTPVNVFVELVRPSDRARSEPREFRYIPNKSSYKPGQKRARYEEYSYSSYESSNLGSEELPVVINNLHIEQNANMSQNNILANAPSGISEEIMRAINDINSDEFKKIYSAHGDEYASYLDTMEFDAAHPPVIVPPRRRSHHIQNPAAVKMEVTKEERQMSCRVVSEFRSFIRTTHKPATAVEMLTHYFGEDKRTNALHVAVCQKDTDSVMLLLKIIAYYRMFDLLEKTNNDKYTALHLAVLCHNEAIVSSLLLCRAKIATMDSDLNTSLHLAVKANVSTEILELLLRNRESERTNEFIDMENDGGNTALMMAVEAKKLATIKLLCMKDADVNKTHPKNGFVPLRVAVEKQYLDIVRFFLSLKTINPTVKDFMNVSPLTAAITKPSTPEITDAFETYMTSNNIVFDVKEEPTDTSEDEMDVDVSNFTSQDIKDEVEVKNELPHLSPDELEKIYEDVKILTPQCLDEVSAILDKSGNWRYIAELLEIEHLVDSNIIHSDTSMSKAVLTYAIETNQDSIWMIRNFLENLDEHRTVEIIDSMVREVKKC